MPWRKYTAKDGKYGPIYHISQGVQVRSDTRGKWTIFIERGGERKNKTIGAGRKGLSKAIKAAEAITRQIVLAKPQQAVGKEESSALKFEQL